jgi:hypothetical protein
MDANCASPLAPWPDPYAHDLFGGRTTVRSHQKSSSKAT